MKSDVTDGGADPYRHTKGLDSAIKVLIIEGVFIMPDTGGRIRYFIADETNPIDRGSRLELGYDCSSPGCDGRLHLHRTANGGEGEAGASSNIESTVGHVVIHVALSRIGLAPGVFVRRDVLAFKVIGGAGILRWIQIADVNWRSMRYIVMGVASVIAGNVLPVTICPGGVEPGEW